MGSTSGRPRREIKNNISTVQPRCRARKRRRSTNSSSGVSASSCVGTTHERALFAVFHPPGLLRPTSPSFPSPRRRISACSSGDGRTPIEAQTPLFGRTYRCCRLCPKSIDTNRFHKQLRMGDGVCNVTRKGKASQSDGWRNGSCVGKDGARRRQFKSRLVGGVLMRHGRRKK